MTGGSGLASNHAVFNSVYDNLTVAGFREGDRVEYPGSDKNFITTTIKNSAFEGNSYSLSAVGDENDNDNRPDDFGSFLRLENNQFKGLKTILPQSLALAPKQLADLPSR